MHAGRYRQPSTALGRSERFKPETLVMSIVRDTDAALLDLRSERCFTLNEVGARIWVLLSQGTECAVIAELLAEEYDAPLHVIAADTRATLAALVRARLARPIAGCDHPAGRPTDNLRGQCGPYGPCVGGVWATTRP
jgi:hypothetical protein